MKSIPSICFVTLLLTCNNVFAQTPAFTNDEYKKAAWMTTRMYGGQRSGHGPNWLTMKHVPRDADWNSLASSKGATKSAFTQGKDFIKDADGTHDLTGGWFDCGDHVKFGQTEYYAAYTLLKGYEAFPHGYDDYYSYDYKGYSAANDYSWEGKKGTPNGIPDILDELRYACEYFIKCARNSTTFYSQVGDGNADHLNWVTSVVMATMPRNQGGEKEGSRTIVKNPADAAMPAHCAATLALMSRMYKKFDPDFAALCLTHAKFAYDYAKANKGKAVAAGSFYPANGSPAAAYASMCAEMYWATGTESYKTEALAEAANITNHNYVYCYNNTQDMAAYNLARLGNAAMLTRFNDFVALYKGNCDANGLCKSGDGTWGPLRYNANTAFIVALHEAYNKKTTIDKFITDQIDYIMGKNAKNFSFIVGMAPAGKTAAEHPHHRNVYLIDDIMANQATMVIPTKNKQHGYLIGGTRNAGSFTESATNYQTSEGGIDYNAGLVGALAYIVSRRVAVDTTKFGHPTPELGEPKSLCGTGSVTLTAKISGSLAPGEQVTYRWYKGTTLLSAENGKTSITVTAADTYHCELAETKGAWTTRASVIVSATLPDVSLGADVALCTETSKTLNAGVSGTGITYTWKKDNVTIAGATAQTYTAYTAGTYSVTVAATGCTAKTGSIKITSQLPQVQHDTVCKSGNTANLKVLSTGTFDWFDVATGGTKVASGATYSPVITANKTFYVQDASAVNGSVGPKTAVSATNTNWGINAQLQLAFTITSSFSITSMKTMINSVYGATPNGTVTVEILDGNGNSFTPKKEFTSNPTNVTATGLTTFTFTNFNIDKAWGTNLRMRLSAKNFNGDCGFNESGATYPYNSTPAGVVTITGSYGSNANAYMYFYDWVIQAGSSCARTPVLAVIDATAPKCAVDNQAPTKPGALAFSSIEETKFTVTWTASTDNVGVTGYEVSIDGKVYKTVTTTSITVDNLVGNTTYSVSVVALDAAGNKSTASTGSQKTLFVDRDAPTKPGTLTFSSVEETKFTVAWAASTDNVAVTGYEVSIDGKVYKTVTTTSITVDNLVGNTTYSVSVVALDAAGNKSTASTGSQKTLCKHNYQAVVTAPTCTVDGFTTYTCSICKDSYTGDKVPAAHTFTAWQTTKEPTCEATGVRTEKCSICGALGTKTETIAKLTEHVWGAWSTWSVVTAAKCEENGSEKRTRSCTLNAAVIDTETRDIPAIGHTTPTGVWTSGNAATCTAASTRVEICARTGCTKIIASENKPALGHDFVNYQSDGNATCKADGTETATCSRCSVTDTRTKVGSQLTHIFVWTVTTTPTCDAGGEETQICSLCMEKGATRSIGKITEGCECKHVFGNWSVKTPATCTELGEETRTCSLCGEIDTRSIPKKEHIFEWKITTAASCENAGVESEVCTLCGAVNSTKPIAQLGHDFKNYTSNNNATCKADGTETGTCLRCGKTDTRTKVGSQLTHIFVWTVTTAPTCDANGEETQICSRCTEEGEVRSIDKKTENCDCKHNYQAVVTAPTCTADGFTTYTCSICGDSYTGNKISAIGHSEPTGKWTSGKAATCTTASTRAEICAHEGCDHVIATDGENALGHKFENYTSNDDATCKEDGTETGTCSLCGEKDTRTKTGSKLEHIFVWTEIVEPTCDTEGKKTQICSLCKEEGETQSIDKKTEGCDCKHNYQVAVTVPTCIEKGYTTYTCTLCGTSYIDDEVEELGHSYPETWTVRTTATCESKGLEFKLCTHENCTHEITQEIPATSEHTFVWKIDPTNPNQEIEVCADCNAPSGAPARPITFTQAIELAAGWNLISIYVVPENAAIEEIFAAIMTNIDIIKNADGFYKPGTPAPLQSLTEMQAGYGYLVKAKTATTLKVEGKIAENVSIPLKQGWNMIGYPFAQSQSTTDVLSPIWNNTEQIKNFDGFLNKTSGNLNTMQAGKGYYIFVTSDGVINY